MKKKKKPSADHQHDEEEDDHDIVHGHNHGQANKDVLPVEALAHEDANAEEDEVEAGRFAGGGLTEHE